MKKQRKKIGGSINEKPPKLDEERPIYGVEIVCRGWKTSETLARKMVEENQMLIWLRIGTRSLKALD